MIVDYIAHPLYVETSGGKVSGHKHRAGTVVEERHRRLAVTLVESAMIKYGRYAALLQILCCALRALAVVHEHDAALMSSGIGGKVLKQQGEGVELVVGIGVNAMHAGSPAQVLIAAEVVDCHRIVELEEIGQHVGTSGRREQRAAHILEACHYLLHLLLETEFERLVKLIEHKYPRGEHIDITPLDMIEQTARSGNDYVGSGAERVDLILHLVTAVKRRGLESGGDIACDTGNL